MEIVLKAERIVVIRIEQTLSKIVCFRPSGHVKGVAREMMYRTLDRIILDDSNGVFTQSGQFEITDVDAPNEGFSGYPDDVLMVEIRTIID